MSIAVVVATVVLLASLYAAAPVTTVATPSGSTGPTHLTHPLIPVPPPPGPTALVTSAASSSGCPLSSSECLGSYNWGGYSVCVPQAACAADEAAPASVTDVKGSWVVPAIVGSQRSSCSDSQKTWYDNSVWVGIDGFVSPTVEQTGTSSDCYYGQVYYYAWYEFYPANSVTISSLTVRPGDTITAEVSYSKGLFTTTIEDMNTRQSYTSPPTAVPGAQTDSAEWIVESAYYNGILALTPFSQVSFTGATATINGATRTIAAWGSNVYWLLMVDYNWGMNAETGVATPYTQNLAFAKAEPFALGRGGGSFDVNWLSSGP